MLRKPPVLSFFLQSFSPRRSPPRVVTTSISIPNTALVRACRPSLSSFRCGTSSRSLDTLQTKNKHPRPLQAPLRHIESGTSTTVLVGAAGIVLVYIAWVSSSTTSSSKAPTSANDETNLASDELSEAANHMSTAVLAGRPGNLTTEQEASLRELWQLALRDFGAASLDTAVPPTTAPTVQAHASAATLEHEQPKRSRFSFFKRKDDHESDSPTSPTVASPTGSGFFSSSPRPSTDDKHGLSRTYQEAIASMKPEEVRTSFWNMVKHDHPDALLLRFLRARKWDVQAALVMAVSALHWRATDAKVDEDIMRRGEEAMLNLSNSSNAAEQKEGGDFMSQIRMGKSFLHGTDREGRPLCYVRVRLHKQGEQSEPSLERYTVYTIETARMFLKPPVDTATILFDMTDFSMANMDYTPVKFMIKCFEANYPESLGAVLVHKAPWIFQGIWRVIRGWLDPVVASKVHFTNDLNDLSNFIDQTSIIAELGGPNSWAYKYSEPQPGENAAMQDTVTRQNLIEQRFRIAKQYEDSVNEWIAAGPTGANSETHRRRRDELAEQLRENYWQLDPYVRARSVYDRLGDLKTPHSSHAPTTGQSSTAAPPAAQSAMPNTVEPPSMAPLVLTDPAEQKA